MHLPNSNHYWLLNAHVPCSLLPTDSLPLVANPIAARDDLALADLEIHGGTVRVVRPAAGHPPDGVEAIDLKQGMVLPCFVDMHTHLDKGHSWGRSPNRTGSFDDALETVAADREKRWEPEDVYRRMAFGLKCSYAHGTKALRTHLDSFGEQARISLSALKALQQEWGDRLILQPTSLVTLDYYMTPEGEQLADLMAEHGGVLGGLPRMGEALEQQLDRVFNLAKERQLSIDFHVDESGNPGDRTLQHIAAAALRHDYRGKVVCGHCCSLAVQPTDEVLQTIELVKQAAIGIVSLPMCNLYLQDRNQQASEHFRQAAGESLRLPSHNFPTHTPRWRGVTLLHELKHAGVPVAIASDNCRDPFYAYGDHDMLEVFTHSTRIAHLESPYGDWCRTATATPADLLGLPTVGRIAPGLPADLILFKARYYSELFSRPQADRVVVRNGEAIDTALPDYAELDDLL